MKKSVKISFGLQFSTFTLLKALFVQFERYNWLNSRLYNQSVTCLQDKNAWFRRLFECIIGTKRTKSGLKSGTEDMLWILLTKAKNCAITTCWKTSKQSVVSLFYQLGFPVTLESTEKIMKMAQKNPLNLQKSTYSIYCLGN